MSERKYPNVGCAHHPADPQPGYLVCFHVLQGAEWAIFARATPSDLGIIFCHACGLLKPTDKKLEENLSLICSHCAREHGLLTKEMLQWTQEKCRAMQQEKRIIYSEVILDFLFDWIFCLPLNLTQENKSPVLRVAGIVWFVFAWIFPVGILWIVLSVPLLLAMIVETSWKGDV